MADIDTTPRPAADPSVGRANQPKTRALTGIQPSGGLHIGNYLGAVKNWVRMSHTHDMLTCIVDYHALTGPVDPAQLQQRTFEMAVAVLSAGLEPDRATLFVQSQVPEVTELTWIYLTMTPLGDLERMTQYKDKAARQQSILSGLLTYPVLQAADILIYKAAAVPVGEDQIQHIELTREIARRFNQTFGDTFPEPKAVVPELGGRIRGLDGKAKMSKSIGNTIELLEAPDSAWNKLRTAMTDPARLRRSDPGDPHQCNIYNLHRNFSGPDLSETVEVECARAGIGCTDCKAWLFESMERELAPIRERAAELNAKPAEVHEILAAGAARARQIARTTLDEVRDKIGFYRP
ncbi:MAG: tryptophan--tRNA ligase [Trueperaceae bacterium]|nr:tryptophan--tRNA ligase [Trueperaceae bacterium]